jgi:hypothetical protein
LPAMEGLTAPLFLPSPSKKKPPKPSIHRSTIQIKSHRTPSIGLISALDPPTDDSHLMKSL